MEYITSRKKIGSLLHPVDDESTAIAAPDRMPYPQFSHL